MYRISLLVEFVYLLYYIFFLNKMTNDSFFHSMISFVLYSKTKHQIIISVIMCNNLLEIVLQITNRISSSFLLVNHFFNEKIFRRCKILSLAMQCI